MRPFFTGLSLLALACTSDVLGPGESRIVPATAITPPRIAPTVVRPNTPVVIDFATIPPDCSTSPADPLVEVRGLEVEIRPRLTRRSPSVLICALVWEEHPHRVTVTFRLAGTARIRFVGPETEYLVTVSP